MSVIAVLVLAAEEAESSKAAFYIGGGLLAVWALVLSVVGLTQPDFPRDEKTARGVYGLSALLVAIAAATAIITG